VLPDRPVGPGDDGSRDTSVFETDRLLESDHRGQGMLDLVSSFRAPPKVASPQSISLNPWVMGCGLAAWHRPGTTSHMIGTSEMLDQVPSMSGTR
jgi:hypothetical protein